MRPVYVLVRALPTRRDEVLQELWHVEDVVEVRSLLGQFDFIAEFGTDADGEGALEPFERRVRTLAGVEATKVLDENPADLDGQLQPPAATAS